MNEMRYFHARVQRSLQTAGYLVALTGLLLLSGWLFLGWLGVLMMLGVTVVTLAASSRLPLPVVMRMKRARPLSWGEAESLQRMTLELAAKAGLEVPPRLYLVPSRELQAFAVSSGGEAAIGITPALVHQLRPDELEGVLAHEISHLASGDTKVMSAASAMRQLTRSLASLAWVLLLLSVLSFGAIQVSLGATTLLVVAPILSYLAELGLSRTREFSADLAAARLTARPQSLARALAKLEVRQTGLLRQLLGPQVIWRVPEALRTHPSTEERIRRLLELDPRWREPLHRGTGAHIQLRPAAQRSQQPRLVPVRYESPVGRNTRWSVTSV